MKDQVDRLKVGADVTCPSFQEEVGRLSSQRKNLIDLQLNLWNNHRIAARGTIGDGNCGIETLVGLSESGVASVAHIGGQIDRADMLRIIQQYRSDLSEMWSAVSSEPFWQKIWQRFVGSHVGAELDPYKKEPDPRRSRTPSPKKNERSGELEVTPGNPPKRKGRKGKLLGEHGEAPLSEVLVSAELAGDPAEGEPPAKKPKKKPSGKKKDASEIITVEVYFPRLLSEKGVTYREWLNERRKDLHIVHHGSMMVCGQHIRLSKNEMVLVRACKNWIWIGALGSAMFFHFSNLITHSF